VNECDYINIMWYLAKTDHTFGVMRNLRVLIMKGLDDTVNSDWQPCEQTFNLRQEQFISAIILWTGCVMLCYLRVLVLFPCFVHCVCGGVAEWMSLKSSDEVNDFTVLSEHRGNKLQHARIFHETKGFIADVYCIDT
jgi:hypothetical protein